jgi:hypothetical protein
MLLRHYAQDPRKPDMYGILPLGTILFRYCNICIMPSPEIFKIIFILFYKPNFFLIGKIYADTELWYC